MKKSSADLKVKPIEVKRLRDILRLKLVNYDKISGKGNDLVGLKQLTEILVRVTLLQYMRDTIASCVR